MSSNGIAILILIVGFLLLVALRVQIAFAVAIASCLCLTYLKLPYTTVVTQMVKGVYSFSLMAVPFFITMGSIMGAGGISNKLVALAESLVGWMHGGLAMVNIVTSYFFGGISGSAAADTASVGKLMIPMMVEAGYDADFSTAAGGVSVGALFMAGYLPGALLAVSLMIFSYIISMKRNYPKGKAFSIKNFFKQLKISIWALLAILIVVVGVVCGVFTATESAAIAVLYSLLVSMAVYRELNWKSLWAVFGECIDTLAMVLILCGTSSIFGYCLTYLHVPDLAASAITSVTTNKILLTLLINLILLVLGCIMDMAPIVLIATPILLPLATSIGISPIQFGIMMILNCGIGLLTPPVGTVLFIGSAVSGVKIEKIVKATLPFYLAMVITLLLLSFVPAVSLFLPHLVGYAV